MPNRAAAGSVAVLLLLADPCGAETLAPDFSSGLGAYPVLQFFGGLIVLAGMAVAAVRTMRQNMRAEPPPTTARTEVYMDGPIGVAMKLLERIVVAIEGLIASKAQLAELREQCAHSLSETRQQFYRRFEEVNEKVTAVERDCAILKDRSTRRGG